MNGDKDPAISRREAARRSGLSYSTLKDMARDGRIPIYHGSKVKLSDVLAARGLTKAPAVAADAGSEATGARSLYAERARYMRSAADLKKLQADEKAGRLIDREIVEKTVFSYGRQIRDAWTNWPSRVAALIAADLGADSVLTAVTLEKYVRKHLVELSEGRGLDLSPDR